MESFSVNSAKSFLGKHVNLHLKDGAVIVNVQLTSIKKNDYGKGRLIEYVAERARLDLVDNQPQCQAGQ